MLGPNRDLKAMELDALRRNQVTQQFRVDGPQRIIVMRGVARPRQTHLQPTRRQGPPLGARLDLQIRNQTRKHLERDTQRLRQAHQRDEGIESLGSRRKGDPLIGQTALRHQGQQGRRTLDHDPPHPLPRHGEKPRALDEIAKALFTVHEQRLVGPVFPVPTGLAERPANKLRTRPPLPPPPKPGQPYFFSTFFDSPAPHLI